MNDPKDKDWLDRLQDFRKEKDEFFATNHESPLAHGGSQQKTRLRYFPPDPKYKTTSKLNRYGSPGKITLTTSKGTRQQFHRLGFFEIEIDGKRVKLQAYKSAERESNDLFIPFRDGTSGKESYGSARYLDIEETPDDVYALDFNYAYNPYCAYSNEYTCPLPPKDNWLETRIPAGEMSYHS